MEIAVIIAGIAVIGYYLMKGSNPLGSNSVTLSQTPVSGPTYKSALAPGTIAVSTLKVPAQPPQTSVLSEIQLSTSMAQLGIGEAESLSQSITGTAISAGTDLGKAIPIIGSVVGVVTSVLSIISAHHQQALANEGKVLNTTEPTTMQDLILVAQAAVQGEITSVAQAKTYTDQIVSDWYLQVKPIQRGTWHYTLTPTQDPTILGAVGVGGPGVTESPVSWFGSNIAGDAKPDPCNAACVVGHYHIERDAAIVLLTVQAILSGKHGVMTLPKIPPYMTQIGAPQLQLTY